MAGKHIGIDTWLEALGLQDYTDLFKEYNGVENILFKTEAEIKDLGVKHSGHRAKIVSSLRFLRDKYEKGRRGTENLYQQKSPITYRGGYSSSSISDLRVEVTPEIPSVQLQSELHRELSGDPCELKSHAWYHGSISRQKAEGLVTNDRAFLLRDCISRPGDFVLTSCWSGRPLNFMVNAHVTQRGPNALPKVTYMFEQECFDSVYQLIHYYIKHEKPVTISSGAIIKIPVARRMPLSHYDTKYGAQAKTGAGTGDYSYSSVSNSRISPHDSPKGSPGGSPSAQKRNVHIRSGSQPLLSLDRDSSPSPQDNFARSGSMPVIVIPSPTQLIPPRLQDRHTPSPTNTPPSSGNRRLQPEYKHFRSGSEPVLNVDQAQDSTHLLPPPPVKLSSAVSDSNLNRLAPPKPSRIPSVKYKGRERPKIQIRNKELYEDDDRDYSDYTHVREEPSWLKNAHNFEQNKNFRIGEIDFRNANKNRGMQNVPKSVVNNEGDYDNNFSRVIYEDYDSPPSPTYDTHHKKAMQFKQKENVIDHDIYESQYDINRLKNRKITIPEYQGGISFDHRNFTWDPLPKENKPLEASVMQTIKSYLSDSDAHMLAQHMTHVDLNALKITNVYDLGVGVQSGLELLTLPQGKQLRQDVIERCHCMKMFVTLTILTSNKAVERADILSKWIHVAQELKFTLGNLLGFVNVLEALTSYQITRLRDTWIILRQKHTNSAYIFDTKLRTSFNSLKNSPSFVFSHSICIPNVGPVASLLEALEDDNMVEILHCDMSDGEYGLDIMLSHLDTTRVITAQQGLYKTAGLSLLENMKVVENLLAIFKTEFHLRLLWGARGAGVQRSERFTKFKQILTVLSERVEPPDDDGTAV